MMLVARICSAQVAEKNYELNVWMWSAQVAEKNYVQLRPLVYVLLLYYQSLLVTFKIYLNVACGQ